MKKNLLKKLKKGFTLVEMLVVVAIVGVLSTSIYVGYQKYVDNSKITVAKSHFYSILECFETAMLNNTLNERRPDDEETTPYNYRSFNELILMDLNDTYNEISEKPLPKNIKLSVDGFNIIYEGDGVELIYDTETREITSISVY